VLTMPEEEKSRGPVSPIAMWEQWYEAATRAWTPDKEGATDASVAPFGLYRAWLKSTREPQEAWKRWFDATTEPWRKLIENGANPAGLVSRWLEMMEEARARLLQGGSVAADPFTFFKQWYEASSETWGKVIEETIGGDRFMGEASQFLESYANFVGTVRRTGEEYFGHLQLSTRSDAARIAELVINVENKVEQLDETFENYEESNARARAKTNEALASLPARIDGVEGRLEKVPAALQKAEKQVEKLETSLAGFEKSTGKALAGLAGRFDSLEQGLETLPGALEKAAQVDQLEKRLDRVESKLETLLTVLQQVAAREPAAARPPSTRKKQNSRNASTSSKNEQAETRA
jgi:polyhydroxyalkanoic acid synthase PhaR subunit